MASLSLSLAASVLVALTTYGIANVAFKDEAFSRALAMMVGGSLVKVFDHKISERMNTHRNPRSARRGFGSGPFDRASAAAPDWFKLLKAAIYGALLIVIGVELLLWFSLWVLALADRDFQMYLLAEAGFLAVMSFLTGCWFGSYLYPRERPVAIASVWLAQLVRSLLLLPPSQVEPGGLAFSFYWFVILGFIGTVAATFGFTRGYLRGRDARLISAVAGQLGVRRPYR